MFFGFFNVKFNFIGFLIFIKFKEGYVMLVFVGVIFLFYFVGFIWVRCKDRVDVIKVSVIVKVLGVLEY